jgi:hypothetical protein
VHCARVAWERITSSPGLAGRYDGWDVATAALAPEDRYKHPTWSALVAEYEAHHWPDCNDTNLAEEEVRKAEQKRRAKRKPPKTVSRHSAERIAAYRNDRALELITLWLSPRPPLWIRNRTLDRCVLLADAWEARELLYAAGAQASGREVKEWLAEHGRLPQNNATSIVKRVEEALRRVDRLLGTGEWPAFDTGPDPNIRRPGHGLHSATVYELLES